MAAFRERIVQVSCLMFEAEVQWFVIGFGCAMEIQNLLIILFKWILQARLKTFPLWRSVLKSSIKQAIDTRGHKPAVQKDSGVRKERLSNHQHYNSETWKRVYLLSFQKTHFPLYNASSFFCLFNLLTNTRTNIHIFFKFNNLISNLSNCIFGWLANFYYLE